MRIPRPGEMIDYARRLGVRRALYRGAYVLVNQGIALSILDCLALRPANVQHRLLDEADRHERRFLEHEEVERLLGVLGSVEARVAGQAIARGDACYAILDDGRLANFGCYSPRPTPVLNDLVVGFDPPSWYMYGAYTPPAYRGRRLHAVGVLGAALELFDRGVPSLVTVYERTNYRSMVSALRMGWRPCGSLYRIAAGRWVRMGRTSEAEHVGMQLEVRAGET